MVESDIEESESDESQPRFQFTQTNSRRSKVVLPKKFAVAADLIGKTSVTMQYFGRERYWKIALRQQRSSLELGRGWSAFRVGNNLEFGRIYSFKFAKNLIVVSDCNSTSETTNLHPNFNATNLHPNPAWRYVKELKKHHFTHLRLGMPITFAMGVGIATGDTIYLEDSLGTKKWPVTIKDRGRGTVFSMTRGLKDFLRENHMQVGDTLLFEFVPNSVNNVIKFVIMENEAGKEMLAQSGKGGIIMT